MAALWSAFETVYARRTIASTWQALLGDEYERVAAEYLSLRPDTATGWNCPRNCGCTHEVMTRPNGSIAAVCACDPWDCDDIPLTPEDIALYGIDLAALGQAVAKAFGFQRREAAMDLPGTVQIGAWTDQAIPVILTVHWDGEGFRHVIAELAIRLRKGFLLLSPTMRFVNGPIFERVASVGAGILPLEACLRLMPDGSLQALRPVQDLLAPFVPAREAGPVAVDGRHDLPSAAPGAGQAATLAAIHETVQEIKQNTGMLPGAVVEIRAGVVAIRENTEATAENVSRLREDSAEIKAVINSQAPDVMLDVIRREIAAVRTDFEALRSAKERLEQMVGDGFFAFTQKVDARSFKILCTVLAEGDVAKASRTLGMTDSALRKALGQWHGRGKAYQTMLDIVRWRKSVGRKETVPLNDALLHDRAETVDHPALIADVLDGLFAMTEGNWQEKCEELADLLRPHVVR